VAFHNPIKHLADPMADDDSRRKRALYRAHHRGTKEMDIVLGGFADAEITGLSAADLATFELLLALPDPEIDRMVKGSQPPPDLMALMGRIRRHYGLGSEAGDG
jgi:antitoxin CptB